MTPQTKGTLGRVVAGILIGVFMLGLGLVLSNDKEVAALKVRVEKIEDAQRETRGAIETNRVENNGAHQRIEDMLREIQRDVKK